MIGSTRSFAPTNAETCSKSSPSPLSLYQDDLENVSTQSQTFPLLVTILVCGSFIVFVRSWELSFLGLPSVWCYVVIICGRMSCHVLSSLCELMNNQLNDHHHKMSNNVCALWMGHDNINKNKRLTERYSRCSTRFALFRPIPWMHDIECYFLYSRAPSQSAFDE